MKRETAWLMGGAALLTTAAAGASIWNNYGALLRWTEPALPRPEIQLAPRTVVYKKVDAEELSIDLYYPPGEGPFPVAVYAHGGAFVRGTRDDLFCFSPIVDRFLELGIAVASIDYRLFAEGVYFPANLEDVRDALCFIQEQADDLMIQRGRLLVWGDSAGAALLLTTALAPEEFVGERPAHQFPLISGVIALYPPTNYLLFKFVQTWIAHIKFYEGNRDDWRALMTRCSPATHLSAESPPIMLLHGKKDPIVPFSQALHFIERGADVGADIRLFSFPNGTHSLASFAQTENPVKIERLLERIESFSCQVLALPPRQTVH
ncbi:alpha/beta hydrolase [Exiguobacterium flavidum]|uniref:alpha/beta hydrolase n=1 Tax=Exiguobacterium flavidum TaxID=2184695 RepID=UPI000DF7264A|nr:alpha/beta hydrolase [Exiguobacterium flavidum]